MNLVLHGLFFQVIASIVHFQHGTTLCSAGEPGYLDFDNLPETNFSCQGKVIGGYYADVEAGCQMFHVCTIGQKDEIMDIKFLCLNGTVFDQETRVCERVDEVDCSKSERFYNLNLELYGNNAVTLSLHDASVDDDDDRAEVVDDSHELQRTTSSRPNTTSTTTTQRPIISSTTSASGAYQHPNGYPQHYQPQPRFPSVQTSQSKSLYDDKNGGYHHQYIYHTGDQRNNNLENNNDGNNNSNNQNHNSNNNNANNNNNNNQATSYQLFSNQGVSSTTGNPQIHQIRYSSTPGPSIQIRNDHQPTISPIFHATSSTIQTLLNSNANSPALINPIFHSHGIASTTEQFTVHNNSPREADEYRDSTEDDDDESSHDDRRPLEAIQPTTQGKVSKLKISPISVQQESSRNGQRSKDGDITSEQHRVTTSFLATSNDDTEAVRSFYPTPRTSTKSSSSHVTQHIHIPPLPSIPQLKPHQVTINLSPPDIQRIVQNPSPLLPSQSRVIVTAKASVSDESGRSLNTTQLVTLPLPTIPASYDDYKEGDESFDPFYRDVPKIRNNRKAGGRFRWPVRELREKRSFREKREITDAEIGVMKMDEKVEDQAEEIVELDSTQTVRNISRFDSTSLNYPSLPDVTADRETLTLGQQPETDDDKKVNNNDTVRDENIDIDPDVNPENTRSGSGDGNLQDYVNPLEDTFHGKIFDDPEARTSKEVDTRAVSHDSKRSKDLNNSFGKDAEPLKERNSKGLESLGNVVHDQSSRFSLDFPAIGDSLESKENQASKNIEPEAGVQGEEKEVKNKKESERKDSYEEKEVSEEENSHEDYYYGSEMDESSGGPGEEDYTEYSNDAPNKINSSRHHKSLEGEDDDDRSVNADTSGHQEKNNEDKYENYQDDYEVPDIPTTANEEEVTSSEMSGEYVEDEETSFDNSHEVQDDEEDTSNSRDYTTVSQESYSKDSEEMTSSTEKTALSNDTEIREDSDGVLKFTDEIPSMKEIDEPEEPRKPVSLDEISQDYIDDNYEPQSYKEKEEYSSTTDVGIIGIFEELTTVRTGDEKIEEEEEKPTTEITSMLDISENTEIKKEEKQNDEPPLEKTSSNKDQLEKSIEDLAHISPETATINPTTVPTTTTSTAIPSTTPTLTTVSTSTSTTTAATTTSTTTTTTTTTTTSTTTTTTPRPTPPKLFKPFTLRKSYVYVPPSTTPVPVIIKPRLTLLNPKPSKPLKSYNDRAPKPVIRKSPLFARKISTTVRATTPDVENLTTSTDIPVASTNVPNVQENVSSTSSEQDRTTVIPESSSIMIPTMKTDPHGGFVVNNESPSSTQIVEILSTTKSPTFTPYPLLKIIETASTTEKIPEDDEKAKSQEITTPIPDVDNNNVPSLGESTVKTTTPEVTAELESIKFSSTTSIPTSTEDPRQLRIFQIEPTSDSTFLRNNVAVNEAKTDVPAYTSTVQASSESTTPNPLIATTLKDSLIDRASTLASIHSVSRKPSGIKRVASFNCLEKEMYRFYADGRDCRLFHYCSPGFTSRQVLDFRFVCEEGTAFDEETQSCVHDLDNPKCRKRVW